MLIKWPAVPGPRCTEPAPKKRKTAEAKADADEEEEEDAEEDAEDAPAEDDDEGGKQADPDAEAVVTPVKAVTKENGALEASDKSPAAAVTKEAVPEAAKEVEA